MILDESIGQKLLLAFAGKEDLPAEFLEALQAYRPGGVTLYRALNIDTPEQVRRLTDRLQAAAAQVGLPPLLIATDQESGQLMAIGGATPLPGNLAIGATGSEELAHRAGEVLGRELRAMGLNMDYAPCVDVNINPLNPVVGTRSFGEDPQQVARLGAAMIAGIQSQGVAAVAKHFPGHGDTASDSHHSAPVVPHALERLRQVEFVPFQAAIQAGVRVVMSAHVALPALTGRSDLPATLSPQALQGLLRGELRFDGVIVTDALDMHAIPQGEAFGESVLLAAQAGADLLLIGAFPADQRRAYAALTAAVRDGRLDSDNVAASAGRIQAIKDWLAAAPPAPGLEVVGCAEHLALAEEIAARALTLVKDEGSWKLRLPPFSERLHKAGLRRLEEQPAAADSRRRATSRSRCRDFNRLEPAGGQLPLTLPPDARIAVVLPQPGDLTPADTSSYVKIELAAELRRFHPHVDEFIVPGSPGPADIAAVLERLPAYDLVIVGTINAFQQPGQAELVNAILATPIPAIVVAMRMPYGLAAFSHAPTYICTYSILPPAMKALANALFGKAGFPGKLPVTIPGF